ncbi:MAG TPA: hypothetical protein VK463_20875, partial [Desulfomonilaceae bacterium]|nr:hypothetical protein [Desulfomonilaceae bacterium]
MRLVSRISSRLALFSLMNLVPQNAGFLPDKSRSAKQSCRNCSAKWAHKNLKTGIRSVTSGKDVIASVIRRRFFTGNSILGTGWGHSFAADDAEPS